MIILSTGFGSQILLEARVFYKAIELIKNKINILSKIKHMPRTKYTESRRNFKDRQSAFENCMQSTFLL